MKKPDSNRSALQRMVDTMKADGSDIPALMRKIQQALAGTGDMQDKHDNTLVDEFDAVVADVLQGRRTARLRAPAAKPASSQQSDAEWKKLETELEQELIRKFNL